MFRICVTAIFHYPCEVIKRYIHRTLNEAEVVAVWVSSKQHFKFILKYCYHILLLCDILVDWMSASLMNAVGADSVNGP